MARITRKHQKVFAGSAANNGQFGSAQAGTKVLSNDPDTLQALAAFDNGWNDATISSAKLPTLEEMQALHFITTRQIAYLFQEGIPEYSSEAEYYQNSIVRKSGTYELYGSKINTNTGNALPVQTDDANWQYLGDLAVLSSGGVPVGTVVSFSTDTEPTDFFECDGSAISRTTYAELFAVIGTLYGVGDGSTTFNLPDLRGEFIRGYDNGAGNDPDAASRTDAGDGATTGDNVGTKQADEFESHVHDFYIGGNAVGGNRYAVQGASLREGTNPASAPFIDEGGNETRPRNVSMMYCIKYQ